MIDKETKYREILPQAVSLLEGEDDEVACMANLAALLHHAFGFWWTGYPLWEGCVRDRMEAG